MDIEIEFEKVEPKVVLIEPIEEVANDGSR